jgi:hypothetical protein
MSTGAAGRPADHDPALSANLRSPDLIPSRGWQATERTPPQSKWAGECAAIITADQDVPDVESVSGEPDDRALRR